MTNNESILMREKENIKQIIDKKYDNIFSLYKISYYNKNAKQIISANDLKNLLITNYPILELL